jgi:FKBP-type peptidyl-prolyl cis-trans isomerase
MKIELTLRLKFSAFLPILLLSWVMVALQSCNDAHPGYSEVENGVYKKLLAFGDSGLMVATAEYSLFTLANIKSGEIDPNSISRSLMTIEQIKELFPHVTLISEIGTLHEGDVVRYIFPSGFLSTIEGNSESKPQQGDIGQIEIKIEKLFDDAALAQTYLKLASQTGIMDEPSAMEFWKSTTDSIEWMDYNEISVGFAERTGLDSVKGGCEVNIAYHTYLLDGTQLDSLTEMQFVFGKPGQLVQGMQWGLAKMCKGERALILVPSRLAFGENGNSNGIVPEHSPVCFDVMVNEVKPSVPAAIQQ